MVDIEMIKEQIMALSPEEIKEVREWIDARFDSDGAEHAYNAGA